MVVGSSPFSDFTRYRSGMIIINVNGSVARNVAAGLPQPNLTFLDLEIINPTVNKLKKNRTDVVQKEILRDIDLGIVIITKSNNVNGGILETVANRYTSRIFIGKWLRRLIVLWTSGNWSLDKKRNGKLSTGGFAVAMVSAFSPKSIYLTGFSFFKDADCDDPPHAYDDLTTKSQFEFTDTRSHSLADSLLLSTISLKGTKIETDDRDLKPLISNWGQNVTTPE